MAGNIINLIFVIFIMASCSHMDRLPADRPAGKYGLHAQPLSLDHSSLAGSKSFWKIIPYYRGQKTSSSCSLASTTMVINAILPSHHLDADTKIHTEESILSLSGSSSWKIATAEDGEGLSLRSLEKEIENLLKKLKLSDKYEVKSITGTLLKHSLHETLTGETWVIANFDQGLVMGQGSYGHFSPIASYDPKKDQVLILDSDADWYEPYWISTDLLIKSMNTQDTVTGRSRGYLIIRKKM